MAHRDRGGEGGPFPEWVEAIRSVRVKPPLARRVARLLCYLLVLGLLAAAIWVGGLLGFTWWKLRGTHTAVEGLSAPPPKGPVNFLVIGSDSREGLSPEELRALGTTAVGGQRADTIILVQVDFAAGRALAVSIPRDLRAEIPGMGTAKINASYAGGPSLVVRTVENLTGVEVHHYVEVNFRAFKSVVDAVGGVDICVSRPMTDRYAGLNLPRAGWHHLDGTAALAFVRARHVDPTGDYGRIRRQQAFLRALMAKAFSLWGNLDPTRAFRVVSALASELKTDPGLNVGEMRRLIALAARIRPERVEMAVLPSSWDSRISYDVLQQPDADAVLAALREGVASLAEPSPGQVRVRVLNGSGKPGAAAAAAEALKSMGFNVVEVENAESFGYRASRVVYSFASARRALVLYRSLAGAEAIRGNPGEGADALLVVGERFALAKPAEGRAGEGTAPKTAGLCPGE